MRVFFYVFACCMATCGAGLAADQFSRKISPARSSPIAETAISPINSSFTAIESPVNTAELRKEQQHRLREERLTGHARGESNTQPEQQNPTEEKPMTQEEMEQKREEIAKQLQEALDLQQRIEGLKQEVRDGMMQKLQRGG